MKNVIKYIYKYSIFSISLVFLLFIFGINLISTCHIAAHWSEKTFFADDNPFVHFLVIASLLFVLFALKKTNVLSKVENYLNNNNRIYNIMRVTLFVITFTLCAFWVLNANLTPNADSLSVQQSAAEILAGNYACLKEGGYVSLFQNQIGYVTFSMAFAYVFGPYNYLALGCMNAFFIALIYWILAEIGGYLHIGRSGKIYIQICGLCFLPFLLYTTFIYGTVPGLLFSLIAIWRLNAYFESKRISDFIITTVFSGLSVMTKQNYLIMFVAIVICILFNADISFKRCISCVVISLLMCFLFSYVPKYYLEQKANLKFGATIPSTTFIVMGLSESDRAPGWYTGYNSDTYYHVSPENWSETVSTDLKERVTELSAHKGYTYKFFVQKLASEWIDPTFQSFWVNQNQNLTGETRNWCVDFYSVEQTDKYDTIFNYFNSLLLFGEIAFVVLCKKRKVSVAGLVPLLCFVGGFIFHIFWEAKCQYTIVYFVILIPYAIKGYEELLHIKKTKPEIKSIFFGFSVICALMVLFMCSNSWTKEFLIQDTEEYNLYVEYPITLYEKYFYYD